MTSVLAIDVGTTALKAAVINLAGEILCFERIEFSKIKIEENEFCKSEFPKEKSATLKKISASQKISAKWILALKAACKKMRPFVQNASAVCVTGNGPTLVFSDGTTFLWNAAICKKNAGEKKTRTQFLQSKAGEKKIRKEKNFLDAACSLKNFASEEILSAAKKSIFLPRLLAAKKIFPLQWQSKQKIFGCPEFLICELCGAEVAILPNQKFKAAFWNARILKAFSIPKKKLCRFERAGKILGVTSEAAQKKFFVKKGTPVLGCGPDFAAALVGTNTLRAGLLCDRAGSSEGINLCIPRPAFEKGIRTLPSPAPRFWNASYLIEDPGKTDQEKARNFKNGVLALKKFAAKNGFPFCDKITITGGQALKKSLVQKKAFSAKIKIQVLQTFSAELLGCAATAFVALGKFKNVRDAANSICKTKKIFFESGFKK